METKDFRKITEPKQEQTDEIDLTKIIAKVFDFLRNSFKVLVLFAFNLGDTIFNNIKLIIIYTFLGAALGVGYFYAIKPYYESYMTLSSDYYQGELLENSIQNLNDISEEGNTKVLANLLKISPPKAKAIRHLEVNPVIPQNFTMLMEMYSNDEKYADKLDSLMLANKITTYQIAIEVYDTAALRGLDTVLVNYIRNNEYVKKRIAIDRANLVNLRDKLTRESVNLDTLKKSIAVSVRKQGDAGRNGANNVIMGERNSDPIDIYREDMRLYNERQEIERQLALKSEIEVVDRFIPFGEPKSGTLIKNTIKGAIVGFVLAFLYIFYQLLRQGITRLRYNLQSE